MNCKQCNKEFEPKRSDAKTCSDKCRQDLKRTVTDNIVTDNQPQFVTDKKCGCVPTEMKKCIHPKCTDCPHQYYNCGKWGEHIQNYCEGMCQ